MDISINGDSFIIRLDDRVLINHSRKAPCVYVGKGSETIKMHVGNFDVQDEITERIPLESFEIEQEKDICTIKLFHIDKRNVFEMKVFEEDGRLRIITKGKDCYNRIWLRLAASKDEYVYGGGEQFSYFNLRGRKFPIFTTEQGVGRNKKTMTTFLADCNDGGGGDYWTTFFPQPTFITSRKYYCHIDNGQYQILDFRHDDYHELHMWGTEYNITFEAADTYAELLYKLTGLLGRQIPLPEWAYSGAWLGIQGGTRVCVEKTQRMIEAGAVINAVWSQDWAGVRYTSFGKRLKWDWHWNKVLYPGLDEQIKKWKEEGIHFLAYVNPYVCVDGLQFIEAKEKGYLVRNRNGEDYIVDFGEFYCGIVDFTNPDASEWYSDMIVRNLIDMGIDGWMADFGEYLPVDAVLYSGEDAMIMHNKWPALWAKVNYDALVKSDRLGKAVFFMRAGYTGSQKYATMVWAGDQNVDWSLDDGLASVITAALSLGMSGYGIHTSDIGGYTTLYGMHRTKELFQRWAEFGIFTPVMRTHEGNRPDDNWQFDSDEETISHFAWATRIHAKLSRYIKDLLEENATKGIPLMRPFFIHYEDDKEVYNLQYQYMFGRDLAVAPIYNEGQTIQKLYLPEDEWVYLWDGRQFGKGWVEIEAPIGKPAVFYRKQSPYKDIFEEIRKEGIWKNA